MQALVHNKCALAHFTSGAILVVVLFRSRMHARDTYHPICTRSFMLPYDAVC